MSTTETAEQQKQRNWTLWALGFTWVAVSSICSAIQILNELGNHFTILELSDWTRAVVQNFRDFFRGPWQWAKPYLAQWHVVVPPDRADLINLYLLIVSSIFAPIGISRLLSNNSLVGRLANLLTLALIYLVALVGVLEPSLLLIGCAILLVIPVVASVGLFISTLFSKEPMRVTELLAFILKTYSRLLIVLGIAFGIFAVGQVANHPAFVAEHSVRLYNP